MLGKPGREISGAAEIQQHHRLLRCAALAAPRPEGTIQAVIHRFELWRLKSVDGITRRIRFMAPIAPSRPAAASARGAASENGSRTTNCRCSASRNYSGGMIRSFRCPDTERLAQGWAVPQFQAFERVALRKLRQLDIAGCLDDLRIPPGNRLEVLRGDRAGQHSIRINDQFRLCFVWTEAGPEAVEIVDDH